MTSQGGLSSSTKRSLSSLIMHSPSQGRKKSAAASEGGGAFLGSPSHRKSQSLSLSTPRSMALSGERTVKRLRLSRAVTVPETTSIKEACQRMAARRVDALLLTDSNALLCGILTDKDIATRVIARELNMDETPASKVMTRNPVFVLSDTLAVEALQKMVQGKFRHLPVVENGEVIALLDITKCLYDAIARLERAAEKGKAIAAAVEGVEKQWGTSASGPGPNTFVETLRERFKPSLSTIISENTKIATVDQTDTVVAAAKRMHEQRASCAVVTVDNKPHGILTSRDIVRRVIALNLPPETTLVEKVMTANPECSSIDSSIVEALHSMHEGKYMHLLVVDKDGVLVTVIDVLNITHAAVTTVGSAGLNNEAASSMIQNFWDNAMALSPDDDDENRSVASLKMQSEGGETALFLQQSSSTANIFAFKIQDKKGRMHRFICDTHSMTELMTAILQRVGAEIDRNNLPQILYEDEDKDKVVLASDNDLVAAVHHARLVGWKGLRLHLDYSGTPRHRQRASDSGSMRYAQRDASSQSYGGLAAGAVLVAALGVYAVLRRTRS
ncbi:CBS domain-containing protein CBSCBSPB5-like isoform X2 [Salvia miltiorrhiza]|uniref:CBS domain-containing protein CBSCBSPB5-like isoform X2 n=1 Tax=Salvia miltiorrhiza TaxID=226208 RepID=UPI0025AB9E6A|nr:CBS domain-containing protein CBSCBSPB5-like isoform X2 [Salvia miltiorrhiza]